MKRMAVLFGALGFLLSGYYATWQVSLLSRGYDVAEIATLIAIGTAIAVVFDIPAGVFADRIGHKVCVLLGIAVYATGFSVAAISANAAGLALTVVIVTIGDALIEGSLESWAADIQQRENKKISSAYFLNLDQSQRLGMIVGAVMVPGFISLIGNPTQVSWLVYAGIAVLILVFGSLLPSGSRRSTTLIEKPALVGLAGHLKANGLWLLLICGCLFGMSDGCNQAAFWPRIKSLDISEPALLGFIQAGMSLSRLVGLQIWKKAANVESSRIPSIALLGSSVFFAAFALIPTASLALSAWFLRVMVLSAFFGAQRALIQKIYGRSGWRATIASGVSTITQLGTIGITFTLGNFPWAFSLNASQICGLGAVFGLASGVMYYMFSRKWVPRDLETA